MSVRVMMQMVDVLNVSGHQDSIKNISEILLQMPYRFFGGQGSIL